MPKRAKVNVEEVTGELGQLFISERALEMIVYGALLEMEAEGLHPPDRVRGAGGILGPIGRSHLGAVQILRASPAEGGEAPAPRSGPQPGGDVEAEISPQASPEPQQEEEEKRLKVKLSLVAEYGVPIHKAAERTIETVRRRVKELAGLDVEEVDVEITGIVRQTP